MTLKFQIIADPRLVAAVESLAASIKSTATDRHIGDYLKILLSTQENIMANQTEVLTQIGTMSATVEKIAADVEVLKAQKDEVPQPVADALTELGVKLDSTEAAAH